VGKGKATVQWLHRNVWHALKYCKVMKFFLSANGFFNSSH